MTKELILYCDESTQKGRHFSDFYGGALVRSEDIDRVRSILEAKKQAQHLFGEVKWTKISANYQQKYIELINTFFDLIKEDKVKIRIMFTDNRIEAIGLTDDHYENKYFLLYYQFLKHAFGLKYFDNCNGVNLRIYLDELPDKREKVLQFKNHLKTLSETKGFSNRGISIREEDIGEVKSHDHVILQCLDIVLGAMQFRLNDLHMMKPPGQRTRGKRTIAKENVYKVINERIRDIYPNFNIGISTGQKGDPSHKWTHPYRHWKFTPSEFVVTDTTSKRKKK